MNKIKENNEDWKKKLDPHTYHITREAGTEAPFTGKYWNEHSKGMYKCSNCGSELFSSDTKFDSGTGWPSFTKPANKENIELKEDLSGGLARVEVRCKKCGAHLGHVFDDLPADLPAKALPTGQAGLASEGVKTKAGGPGSTRKRFCINSASLNLDKRN